MVNKSKKLVAAIILALLAGGGLYASPLLITSPLKTVTVGKYSGDADNFLSVRSYSDLEFDKWFSALSFASGISGYFSAIGGNVPDEMAQLGFAARFGSIYTALYYGGNAWKNFGIGYQANTHDYTLLNVGGKTIRHYLGEHNLGNFGLNSSSRENVLYNECALLLGIGDLMGFRLSYATNYQSMELSDFATVYSGTTEYHKSFLDKSGYINPGIAFGLARELVPGRGIKPELRLDPMLFYNFRKGENYIGSIGSATGGQEIYRSGNKFFLELAAALGGFTLKRINDFSFGLDFEYGMVFETWFNNEYSYKDASGMSHVKKLNANRYGADNFQAEIGSIHTLNPSLTASWEGDRLSLASGLGLVMVITDRNQTRLGFQLDSLGNLTGDLVNHNEDEKISAFEFAPAIDLGMRWALIPEKFFLNAGGKIELGRLITRSIETKMYNQGTQTSEFTRIENTLDAKGSRVSDGASSSLFLGFTFIPFTNITLEAQAGIAGNNSISVFNTNYGPSGGPVNFFTILATVRF